MIISRESFNRINEINTRIMQERAMMRTAIEWEGQFELYDKLIREIKNSLTAFDVKYYDTLALKVPVNVNQLSNNETLMKNLARTRKSMTYLQDKLAAIAWILGTTRHGLVEIDKVEGLFENIEPIKNSNIGKLDYVRELIECKQQLDLIKIAFESRKNKQYEDVTM